ncbi:MAG UNVERIFIED_CONTAM: hypothetical protein LVR18_19820 [Planctomycetaceae bacterium]
MPFFFDLTTQAAILHSAPSTWGGWSFLAQDRELRLVAVELPPPAL